jgi:hypothetical protein
VDNFVSLDVEDPIALELFHVEQKRADRRLGAETSSSNLL